MNPEASSRIVCKFGGSSLASAAQFRKVRAIVEADPRRRIVVPSAPGKRDARDAKITDLLGRTEVLGELSSTSAPPSIDLRPLPCGVHLLHLEGDRVHTLRLVKE